MNKQMTNADIIRLGRGIGFDFSAEECQSLTAHIQKQLQSFEMLNCVDTDGVAPTFDLQGEGRFKVGRSGE